MPKFFCDYCDVYLTHDSMSVRKAHNSGRNHIRNVIDYYQQIGHDKAQELIDLITSQYTIEGQSQNNPLLRYKPLGPGGGFPPGYPPPGNAFPPSGFPPGPLPMGRGLPMPPQGFPPGFVPPTGFPPGMNPTGMPPVSSPANGQFSGPPGAPMNVPAGFPPQVANGGPPAGPPGISLPRRP